jgi:hypothetical protein
VSDIEPEPSRADWLAAAGASSEDEARRRLAELKSQQHPSAAQRRWRRVMRFITRFGQDSGTEYEMKLARKGDPDVLHKALEDYERHPEKFRKIREMDERDAE